MIAPERLKKILEYVSFYGAIFAALLLAINIPISGYAYIIFVCADIATLYLIKNTDAPVVIKKRTIFFMISNFIGIVRWLM
jgi:hypothetical protein